MYSEEDDEFDEDDSDILEPANWRSVASSLFGITAFATSFGAVVGAAVAVMPWASWAACIGAGVWGLLVALAGMQFAQRDLADIVPKLRKGFGCVLGLMIGAIQGALFGIMAVAFIGAVLGGIVGLVLRRLFRGRNWLVLRIFPNSMLFAAACGVAVQAFYQNQVAATNGFWAGALIGLGSGLLFCLVSLPLAFFMLRRDSR